MSVFKTQKDRDASLEEISLKIISSIIREKMELEQQCDQMSALQHSAVVSLEECGFGVGVGMGAEAGWRGEEELGRVLDNARDARDELKRHQALLRAALTTLTTATTAQRGMFCKKCEEHKETTLSNGGTSSVADGDCERGRSAESGDDEDRICPLCGRVFSRSTQFDEFHAHVLTHFSDEDVDTVADDYEMLD